MGPGGGEELILARGRPRITRRALRAASPGEQPKTVSVALREGACDEWAVATVEAPGARAQLSLSELYHEYDEDEDGVRDALEVVRAARSMDGAMWRARCPRRCSPLRWVSGDGVVARVT